jgi:phosphate:Na+ symporter
MSTAIMILFRIIGGLCLFLYGMKVMSDGIQHAAGDRLHRFLNLMTKNRFVGIFTGMVVTALVQSSSAVSVMVVTFVNAGLLSLTQSIGVIMGANIGTTTTAWIVSLVGLELDISALALPAVGIGFFMQVFKWKHRDLGEAFMGFGFIFLGLRFLTDAMPSLDPGHMDFIRRFSDLGFLSILIGLGLGTAATLLMHSSAATITLTIAMAMGARSAGGTFSPGMIGLETAAAMILGANIGTTIDAIMAAIGAKTAARRTALVHVLFNVVGSMVAVIFIGPLLALVDILSGGPEAGGIATRLAMFHTIFNVMGTLMFLPFIPQFAAVVSFLIKDKEEVPADKKTYHLQYVSGTLQNTPELNIVRAEKEIRDMAGLASSMFANISGALQDLPQKENKEQAVDLLVAEMGDKEEFADEMRVELTRFLIECRRPQLSGQSERKIYQLLRIISDLEDMTDDCYSAALLLDRSVKKKLYFKGKEMEALAPYTRLVEDFLTFVREHLGRTITEEQEAYAAELENSIDKSRDRLRKMGRKQIEAGADVKAELLFIDVVRRIEKVGDYCYNIARALRHNR